MYYTNSTHPWGPKVAPASIYLMPLSRISSCYQKIARLGSRFCEQQQGPLKGPGTLLFAHWATAVHRGQPVGWISYPRHGGYTTAPYVLCTYYVCIGLGAAPDALEVSLGSACSSRQCFRRLGTFGSCTALAL